MPHNRPPTTKKTSSSKAQLDLLGFSTAQKDALLEIFNIGMSKAATQLSTLLNAPIEITVPKLDIWKTHSSDIESRLKKSSHKHFIHQSLTKALMGDALLGFKHDYADLILTLLLGKTRYKLSPEELRSCQKEGLLEVGNVIISSTISAISNIIALPISLSTPTAYTRSLSNLSTQDNIFSFNKHTTIFRLSTSLTNKSKTFSSELILLFPVDSAKALIHALGVFDLKQ